MPVTPTRVTRRVGAVAVLLALVAGVALAVTLTSGPPSRPEPPEPPEHRTPALLGVYNGPGPEADQGTIDVLGAPPEVASTYYQPEMAVDVPFESARMARGTSPNITITTKGTQLIAGIAGGEPDALAWLDRYVTSLKQLARLHRSVPVYATFQHEFKASTVSKDGAPPALTGVSTDPAVYGRALAQFFERLDRPGTPRNLRSTYWMVGSDQEFETIPGENWGPVGPDYILFDPYARLPTDTLAGVAQRDIDWIQDQPWYDGQPIALGEFGMTVVLGDDALARYYTDVRGQLTDLGLAWGVLFNRPKDNDHQIFGRTDGQEFPQAVAAFRASLTSAR